MRWADRVTALVLITLAGVWIYLGIRLPFPAFARVSKMSPGAYPIAVAVLLAILAIILFWQTLMPGERSQTTVDPEEVETRNPKAAQHLLIGFAMFVGYVIFVPFLGFALASGLFVFCFVRIIGRFHLLITSALAVGIPALLWTIFAYLLTVPLPKGPWGF